MNVMPRTGMRLGALAVKGLSLLCAVLLFSVSAWAEQIKISDANGNTRSMAELAAGSSATIQVLLQGTGSSTPGGLSVSLTNSGKTTASQTTTSNASGMAEFRNVSAGSYAVTIADSKASISDIRVIAPKAAQQDTSRKDEQTREVGRAMYVGGASAVAGIAGIAAIAGGGSSGGSSSSEGGVGFVNTPGAAVSSSSNVVTGSNQLGQPKPVPEGVAPRGKPKPRNISEGSDPGDPSPPPTSGTIDGTPSGQPVETPTPDPNTAPAPEPVDPMTPS